MSLRLLKLFFAIGAPNYAYRFVMDIFADSSAAQVVTVGSTFHPRDTTIKHFMFPATLTKHMNCHFYPVVLRDAEVMINLPLKSSLMVEENIFFPDMSNPLGPPPPTINTIGDVDTGMVFRSAYYELCTQPNDVLCPLIMHLDRICIDQRGRCSLEPGQATLGVWKVLTRNDKIWWIPDSLDESCSKSRLRITLLLCSVPEYMDQGTQFKPEHLMNENRSGRIGTNKKTVL